MKDDKPSYKFRASPDEKGEKGSPQLRTEACDLAPINWVRAVAVAVQITDPWYACQAFAWCGRFAPALDSIGLIEESFRQARAGKDAYQRLAVSAWPLRALIELGRPDEAARAFDRVAGIATELEPPSSRAEACFIVFQAVAVGPHELAWRAFRWLLTALRPMEHWRQQRAVREAAIEAITLGLIESTDLPQLIDNDSLASQIAARLARGDRRPPRPFFWSRGQPR